MTVANLHISMTPFRNESRVLKETQSLVMRGIVDRVCIIALHEDGLPENEQIDDARRVVRLRLMTRSWPKNLVGQFFKYLEFTWRCIMVARAERATIYNVHSIALLPIGSLLKLLRSGRLVYDAHELETESDGLKGFRKRAAKWIERALIGFADLTIVVGPAIEAWYRQHYPRLTIVTILNVPAHVARPEIASLRQDLGLPDDQRIALYQGGLSINRGIRELIAAAPIFEQAGYAVVFLGYGGLLPEVEDAADRISNVYLHPAVAPADVLAYTASADLGIAWILGNSLSYRLCLPNKLFEYIMAGLPVLVSRLPEMEQVVVNEGIGVCIDSWDPAAVADALAQIELMRGPELDERIERAAQIYSWQDQEETLINAYRDHVLTFSNPSTSAS